MKSIEDLHSRHLDTGKKVVIGHVHGEHGNFAVCKGIMTDDPNGYIWLPD